MLTFIDVIIDQKNDKLSDFLLFRSFLVVNMGLKQVYLCLHGLDVQYMTRTQPLTC